MSTTSDSMRITVFGSRGSCAVSGRDYLEFGGNTSCYLVEAAGQAIILDGGTGLMGVPVDFANPVAILLSHLHTAHIAGFGMYGRLSQKGQTTDIFVPAKDDEEAASLVSLYYAPPLWPLKLADYGGDVAFHAMPASFDIGEVHVKTEKGNHPGGSLLMRLTHGEKSLVFATDYEHSEASDDRLVAFAHDTDLLLFDGQYEEGADYAAHRGFGHSTPQAGIAIQKRSGAKRLLVVHHDPRCTDDMLRERERTLERPDVQFAREGMVIEL